MAKYLMLNSEIVLSSKPCLCADNRGVLFADSFTHFIRGNSSKIFMIKLNFDFIIHSMKSMGMNIPHLFKMSIFATDVELLLQKNRIYKGFEASVTVFRNSSVGKIAENNSVSVLIQVNACQDEFYNLNTKGMSIGVEKNITIPDYLIKNSLSPSFSNYYFINKINDFNIVDTWLLTSNKGVIIRSLDSLVLFAIDNKIVIPKIVSPVYLNIILSFVIRIAREQGYYVYKGDVTEKDIVKFDEIFLINPMFGIKWVQSYKDKRFYHKIADQFIKEINRRLKIDIED